MQLIQLLAFNKKLYMQVIKWKILKVFLKAVLLPYLFYLTIMRLDTSQLFVTISAYYIPSLLCLVTSPQTVTGRQSL